MLQRVDFANMLKLKEGVRKDIGKKQAEYDEKYKMLKAKYSNCLEKYNKELNKLNAIIKKFDNEWDSNPQFVEYQKEGKKLNKEYKKDLKKIELEYESKISDLKKPI